MVADAAVAPLSPPEFLRLAGHPLRWRLLEELARSDRSVGELTALVDEPQNLVSYHLGKLRAGALVASRRSSADGRDTYYSADLDRLGALLTSTGAALDPSLAGPTEVTGRRRSGARVLYLCTGNSARSQMAEALTTVLSDGAVEAASAGSHPKPLHPGAVEVMRARGLDISGKRPKHVDELVGRRFDVVVTLCDRVKEVCPAFRSQPELVHWSLPDPSQEPAPEADPYRAFERTAAVLEARIPRLLRRLARPSTSDRRAAHAQP